MESSCLLLDAGGISQPSLPEAASPEPPTDRDPTARSHSPRPTAHCPPSEPPRPADGEAIGDLRVLFRGYRWQILATYLLFNLENLGRLAQPFLLGWAIKDLLAGRLTGLFLLVAQHLVNLALGAGRQLYDTWMFTRIYAELATRLVIDQRRCGVDLSRLAARSALAREIVDFFERDVPFLFYTLYTVGGSLVMLALGDHRLLLPCLVFLTLAGLLTRSLASQTLKLNRGLNDQMEREVGILQHGSATRVANHYRQVRLWRMQLTRTQAGNFAGMGLLSLLLMAAVLFRSCRGAESDPGALFARLGYVVMLTTSLTTLPLWIQQFSRLRDICSRLREGSAASEGASLQPPLPAPSA